MKKFLSFFALCGLTLAAGTSCTKEAVSGSDSERGTISISIKGEIGDYDDNSTKASVENTMYLKWAVGDVVYVYEDSNNLGSVSVTSTELDGKVAYLGGTITAPSAESATLVFVCSNAVNSAPSVSSGSISIDLASQSAATPFVAVGKVENFSKSTSVSAQYVQFDVATSVIRTVVTGLPMSTEVSSVKVEGLNTKCNINLSTLAVTGDTQAAITKTLTSTSTSSSGKLCVDIATVATDAASDSRKITFTCGGGGYVADFTKSAIVTKGSYTTAVEILSYGGAHDYVIIDNMKWATMNIGATTVAGDPATCYGDYFAWGETETYLDGAPRTAGSGAVLFKTDKVGNGYYSVKTGYNWTNYCNNSSFTEWSPAPYTSNVLTENYDVAKQKWGGKWRMPTKDDFDKLYVACGGTSGGRGWKGSSITTAVSLTETAQSKGVYWCTNVDGVKGALFSDGTSQVFFPAAGYVTDTSLSYGGSNGYYWSSSLLSGSNAYYLGFKESLVSPASDHNRYIGRAVRPVAD